MCHTFGTFQVSHRVHLCSTSIVDTKNRAFRKAICNVENCDGIEQRSGLTVSCLVITSLFEGLCSQASRSQSEQNFVPIEAISLVFSVEKCPLLRE